MKVFTARQIREIDAYTIENEPIPSIKLMERAALALSAWIRKKLNKSASLLFMAGPGNNGGDAWALARMLYHHGYTNIRFCFIDTGELSPNSLENKKQLSEETDIRIKSIKTEKDFPFISEDEWVIDGLFGTGLSRPLQGIPAAFVEYINQSNKKGVISIDIPSGLFSEDNSANNYKSVIKANFTLSFQFPKLSFFLSDNYEFVGMWEILDIGLHPEKINKESTPYCFLTKNKILTLIPERCKFSHKGTYGHALVVAGSYGMMGAAVLAVKSAVHSGAGLVTAHIPRLGYEIMQCSVPEALISLDESDIIFTEVNSIEKYQSVAVGPGLNIKSNTSKALFDLIKKLNVPLVIDADAINILSKNLEWLNQLPKNTILTPHPGEFDRLTKKHNSHFERLMTQVELSQKHKLIIVLKGAHTSITDIDGNVWFNTTGNAGMATGGSGDVLTGIIVSLLAQKYPVADAAKIGVFVHGLAGDIAIKKMGYHALSASDIINNLGKAFKKIEPCLMGNNLI
ncbi:MAG: NAD(P)H-hydrate dehydratase [Bacteroidales bacterium]|nr:NAD(P)H-hydrate dehydratase [Bacteroidales bacterium]MBN2821144.1 NAD(P)H-hydrate dehydratase [Bacteroidales bacterium]